MSGSSAPLFLQRPPSKDTPSMFSDSSSTRRTSMGARNGKKAKVRKSAHDYSREKNMLVACLFWGDVAPSTPLNNSRFISFKISQCSAFSVCSEKYIKIDSWKGGNCGIWQQFAFNGAGLTLKLCRHDSTLLSGSVKCRLLPSWRAGFSTARSWF